MLGRGSRLRAVYQLSTNLVALSHMGQGSNGLWTGNLGLIRTAAARRGVLTRRSPILAVSRRRGNPAGHKRQAITPGYDSLAGLPSRSRGSVTWYPGGVSVVASLHGFADGPVRDAVLRKVIMS